MFNFCIIFELRELRILFYALRKAVGYNDVETAEFLLESGADINEIKRWNSVTKEMMVVLDRFGGDPRYKKKTE